MTWEIAFMFALLLAMLASFAWERLPAELTALAGLAVVLATGLLDTERALSVFSNAAPITVGAMFVISAALERGGAIQLLAGALQSAPGLRAGPALLLLIVTVAAISAFINNTPVVIVFVPVALSLARQLELPASKLLIPLSYASIMGGSCTLIGTSTNIVVSSIASGEGMAPLSLFELAWVGAPLLAAGALYLLVFGYRLLPRREMLTSILSDEEKREYILDTFVGEGSPLSGKSLTEHRGFRASGLKVLEVIRSGVAIKGDSSRVVLQPGDRILAAASARTLAEAPTAQGRGMPELLEEFGLEPISTMEGSFVEVALRADTGMEGSTLGELNFRQRYRLAPVAIHRRGRNLRTNLASTPLQPGDILLLLGSQEAIEGLRKQGDFLVIDETRIAPPPSRAKLAVTLATIAGVVAVAASGLMPVAGAAIVGATLLLLTNCLTMREAYQAIHWPILFLIFGMLGVGEAMKATGASGYLAGSLVSGVSRLVAEPWQPMVLLAGIYVLTNALTEILSNNAAAVLMATLAIGAAQTLEADPRPFVIAVAIAASASFATPIGYQTNTYVYGIGGYRFSDFVKVGLPLNLLAFATAMAMIPLVWSF